MSFIWIVILAAVVFVTSAVGQGDNDLAKLAVIVLIPSSIALYVSPSVIASKRGHPNVRSIAVLNLLLGWTIVGWIGALIWAYSSTATADAHVGIAPATGDIKTCPYCAENIRADAVKCRYCHSDLKTQASTSS